MADDGGEILVGRGVRSNNPRKLDRPGAPAGERRHPAGLNLYFLTVHEPYRDEADGYTVGSTVVHARTLLHASLPQPDASLIYRCVTEFPGRTAGSVVPLSTITFELDGGALWPEVGDWDAVRVAVAHLARERGSDSLRLTQDEVRDMLFASGPTSDNVFYAPDGVFRLGPQHRQQELDALAAHLATMDAQGPVWPGHPLVNMPSQPRAMPYRPVEREIVNRNESATKRAGRPARRPALPFRPVPNVGTFLDRIN